MSKSEDMEGGEYITMWTVQTKLVLDAIEREGVYYVKNRYLTEKYGEAAWIFKEAYRFFTKKAGGIVEKPKEAESLVWMFRDKKWAVPGENGYRMKLSIPAGEIILFDMRLWSKILNLSYMGTQQQEKEFEERLKRIGIGEPLDIFQKPYYPLLKAEIIKSWDRLFLAGDQEKQYEQGAAWMIRKEWIIN